MEDFVEPIWVQQPEELDRWYGRFHRYLLMGSRRSLLGCVHEEEKAAKSASAVRFCYQHNDVSLDSVE